MKCKYATFLLAAATLVTAHAEGLINFHSFEQETKIKGPMTATGHNLYFACEKGGVANYGFIGTFNPAERSVTPLLEFTTETKVKDGFTRVGDELWFVCEKGGEAGFGYVGSYSITSNTVTVLHSFRSETKPKSAPVALDQSGWYFLTEKLGEHNQGALMRFSPTAGLSTVASFSTETGVKAESKPVWLDGKLYYAAREGGDTSQLGGKGAGALGTIDLATGTITKLADFDAANNVAKIKTLLPHHGRLYYAGEEGGDLSSNSGKGFGGLGYYEPASKSFTRLLVCDAVTTGTKPRGLIAVDDDLYFNCAEGGPNGYGTFGIIANGSQATILAANDVAIGAKSDAGITHHENYIYFVTELGCANYLGGISAYELRASNTIAPPNLTISISGNEAELTWPASAADYVLESVSHPDGVWKAIADPGATTLRLPTSEAQAYFRLRR